MIRSLHSVITFLAAFITLLLLAGAVQSGGLRDRSKQDLAGTSGERAPGSGVQASAEFSRTRIVTVTVGTSDNPEAPSLNSRWQTDLLSQQSLTGSIRLPHDASAIAITLLNGEYSLDHAGPTIYITNSQGLYYEYYTDQQVLRFGNQIMISQSYRYNRPWHYVSTVVFTGPYEYVGTAGYVPTQTTTTELHWDQSFPTAQLNVFEAATWLVHPALPRPELEIVTATLSNNLNHIFVTADIRNNGPILAGAPAFINLYDRLAPLPKPAGPLDITNSWCTLVPVSDCAGAGNPLPPIAPGQTVKFVTEYDLSAAPGQHYLFLFVDALGSRAGLYSNQGLNVESAEKNNLLLAGSIVRRDFDFFLPVLQRE